MLERKVKKEILTWMQLSKTALLVSGARQVGKTWLIRQCLQEQGVDYLEVNLIQEPELIPVLSTCKSVEDLVINLSAVKDHTFKRGETVLFLDEVQEMKEILTQIKFWVDDGSFRYILSGSLLGVELRSLRSAPVGYLTEIKMYPMDFEVFLSASGVTPDTLDYLRRCFRDLTPVSEIVHSKMMQHYQRYLVVGGMPAAVQEYVDSGNISQVTIIQRSIIEQYKLDFTKYEEREKKLMPIAVYEQIPSQLMKQNRRFHYSDITKGLRFERVEDSFLWLTSAGVTIPVYNATEPRAALNQNTKSSLLKLYSSDIGLLTCQYGNSIRAKILIGDTSINLGGVYKNAIAQELNTHGFPMFFYNSHKNGELDFLIEMEFSVVPIEVKSGKDYYVHSAISKTVSNPEYAVQKAFVFANCNVSKEGKIVYLPIYLSSFVRDDTELPILQPIK